MFNRIISVFIVAFALAFGIAPSLRAQLPLTGAGPAGALIQPWTPASFGADLLVWYDSINASSFTLSGSTVLQWNDLSGNARHLTSESGKQPNRETVGGFGGQNAVKFDATDDYLKTTSWTQAQTFTVASIYITGASVPDLAQLVDGNGGNPLRAALSLKWSGVSNQPHAFAGASVARHATVLSVDTVYIDITELSGATSKTWINGGSPNPATFNPNTFGIEDGIAIGGPSWASGLSSSGAYFGSFLIINRAMTTDERTQLEAYWGIRF